MCEKLERWWIRYDETMESHVPPRRIEGKLTQGRKIILRLEKPGVECAGTQIILGTESEKGQIIHLLVSAPGGMELKICS